MNYFSHYYFDHLKENHDYNLGLLLPDLLRNYSKNEYNKKSLLTLNETKNDIFKGIDSHLKRDASFHESLFFKSVYEENIESCKNIFISHEIPRYWFGIHILIEMQLDQFLIMEEEELLHNMYRDIEIAIPGLELFLNIIEHRNQEKFILDIQKFIDSKFLLKYREIHGISYGLNKVYQQVNADNRVWSKEIGTALSPLIENINLSIVKYYKTII